MAVKTSWSAGDVLTAADLTDTFAAKVTTPGAWTSYTPTVAQGASTNIAKTVTYAKYAQVGKIVYCNITISLTAAGTTGSKVTLTLPVTSAAQSISIGYGTYSRASGAYTYIGHAYADSTTTVAIAQNAVASPAYLVGGGFAAASGDVIYFSLTYEAA